MLFGVSWGSLGLLLDALEALFATDYVLRGAPKRFSNNIRISNVDFSKMLLFSKGLLLFLMPGGWVWEFKIVPRKVHRV